METLRQSKNFITFEEENYYHYEFGGKHTASKFVVYDGVSWYHSSRKIDE
jgi:hypothetical protein